MGSASQRETLLLTQRDIARLVDRRMSIRVVQKAFEAMARGRALMPPKVYLPLSNQSDFRAMPAFLEEPFACGLKWVNVHPRNSQKGLPTVMAVILISDPATGFPLGIMDGLLITKLRTAAAGAVAARALARPGSAVVGLIGCGAQAEAQLAALAVVFRLSRVKVWGFREGEASVFCRRARGRFPGIAFEPCARIEPCARESDILVTITPSRRPLIRRSWIAPGTHINAIGADAPGKQELELKLLREALIVVDEYRQAMHGGEINVAIRRGQLKQSDIHASLGEVLIGRKRARRSEGEITVFDSTGLAIHDVALADAVLRLARRCRLGRRIRLF